LWWGGLNCLAGCLIAPSGLAAESHCSMSSEGDCCHSRAGSENDPALESVGAPSTLLQPLACCSLESYLAEMSRDMRPRATDGAVFAAVLSLIEFIPESEPPIQLPDRWARLPDRGSTHLLYCVFLI
jgi:hypothetical protein